MRLFIAVEAAGIDLAPLAGALAAASRHAKVVGPESQHITLKFLGETREDLLGRITGVMEAAAAPATPFTIEFAGAGAFPSPHRPRVVWVGVREEAGREGTLAALASALERGLEPLGFRPEGRGFTPHLTVARVKGPPAAGSAMAPAIQRFRDTSFGIITVREVLLKESHLSPDGARYTTAATVALGGGTGA